MCVNFDMIRFIIETIFHFTYCSTPTENTKETWRLIDRGLEWKRTARVKRSVVNSFNWLGWLIKFFVYLNVCITLAGYRSINGKCERLKTVFKLNESKRIFSITIFLHTPVEAPRLPCLHFHLFKLHHFTSTLFILCYWLDVRFLM